MPDHQPPIIPVTDVGRAYAAKGPAEQERVYDAWAARYEPDLCAMGYRIPAAVAAVFVRFVPEGTAPILDAGCGGGIQAEALRLLGYGPIVGIDLSGGMLDVARAKEGYAKLRRMTLGARLDFPDDRFAAVLSTGTITPGHAPPHSLDELVRVARPGAPIVFSLRDDPGQEPQYPAALTRLEVEGRWRPIFTTPSFRSMPYGEPEISHRIHVCEVLSRA